MAKWCSASASRSPYRRDYHRQDFKLLAEDKSLNGLRMASLDFNIVQSETDLIMR